MTVISAPRLLVDGALSGPGGVVFYGGRIVDIMDGRPAPAPDHIAFDAGILSPGLIDLQINGCLGVDFAQATDDEWQRLSLALPSFGVTAFQPTYITNPLPVLVAGLRRFASVRARLMVAGGAHAVGVHLEGPFLSRAHSGAHDVRYFLEPNADNLDALLADFVATAQITMLTLAPELPFAVEAIRRLDAAGIVVSVGHSDATAAQVHDAVVAGARMVTHIFNSQRGFDCREPGVAGQALFEKAVTIGLIADFEHVSPEACAITMNAATGRVALVTDAVAAAGMPPGVSEVGGHKIAVSAEEPVTRYVDGTPAGATTFLDQAVRNLVGFGRDVAEVLSAASTVPADALNRRDLGRLAPGARADIVWWSDDLQPVRTWVDGVEINDANLAPPTRS